MPPDPLAWNAVVSVCAYIAQPPVCLRSSKRDASRRGWRLNRKWNDEVLEIDTLNDASIGARRVVVHALRLLPML